MAWCIHGHRIMRAEVSVRLKEIPQAIVSMRISSLEKVGCFADIALGSKSAILFM
jgi:hypothetical protein